MGEKIILSSYFSIGKLTHMVMDYTHLSFSQSSFCIFKMEEKILLLLLRHIRFWVTIVRSINIRVLTACLSAL